MRNLKLGYLVFGALGIVALLIEMDALKHGFKEDLANTIMLVAGFGVPVVMGFLGLSKPPAQGWQAAAALAGFALAGVKIRIWETAPKIADNQPMGMKLTIIAAAAGAVVSILALIKPESKS